VFETQARGRSSADRRARSWVVEKVAKIFCLALIRTDLEESTYQPPDLVP
jgi:hypothetical protein